MFKYLFLRIRRKRLLCFQTHVMTIILQPIFWIALTLVLGLLFVSRRRKLGLVLGWLSVAMLVMLGWHKPVDYLFRQLESRYAQVPPQTDLSRYAGVVVLGGALEPPSIWQAHQGSIALNDAAERMTSSVTLAQQNPGLKVLFSGGLNFDKMSEADRARIVFGSLGVSPERIQYESRSGTTYENAVFSATIATIDIHRPWLLLTSAYHMPRAMATFQKAGWNMTAYPVDFRTGFETSWTKWGGGCCESKWRLLAHEHIGMIKYKFLGFSD